MKSKFFKETQELESAFDACTPDKLSICLRLDKRVYERMVSEAQRLGLSCGEYLERVLYQQDAAGHRYH